MNEVEHLKELRTLYNRRLRGLEKQAALYGPAVDPNVSIQIDDLREQIAQIEHQLTDGRTGISNSTVMNAHSSSYQSPAERQLTNIQVTASGGSAVSLSGNATVNGGHADSTAKVEQTRVVATVYLLGAADEYALDVSPLQHIFSQTQRSLHSRIQIQCSYVPDLHTFGRQLARSNAHMLHLDGQSTAEGVIHAGLDGIQPWEGYIKAVEQSFIHFECILLTLGQSAGLAIGLKQYSKTLITASDSLDEKTTQRFCHGFYTALAQGKTWQEAFSAGQQRSLYEKEGAIARFQIID